MAFTARNAGQVISSSYKSCVTDIEILPICRLLVSLSVSMARDLCHEWCWT